MYLIGPNAVNHGTYNFEVMRRPSGRLCAPFAAASLLALGAPALPTAQAPQAPAVDLEAPLPFDAAVRTGTLPNGLRYYVRRNERPDNRMLLRLAVQAGSLDEADDQQGLAHLVEHMAFNGSAHFAPGELVSYFESTGARLGPHVNAYTSFEETVYMLELPTDRPEIVERGLTALADVAGGLTLDADQIDRERGVVVEEWRGRLGASQRIGDEQLPVLFHESRYADRLPIGEPEVIRGAPVERLRHFYDTWYQPARMALIVVGDVDPDAIEGDMRTVFGELRSRAPSQPRVLAPVPPHDELLVNVATDPEVTQSTVQLVRKQPATGETTVGDYRRQLVEGLFSRMLNERLNELARRRGAPFLAAGAGGGSLARTVDTYSLSARVPDGSIVDGLEALLVEARRVVEFGFFESELERAKRSMFSSYERAYNERATTESASYAREYVSHFLTGEPSPGIAYEHELVQATLPGITLDEVSALARERLDEGGPVLLAVAPEKPGLTAPSERELRAAIAAVDDLTIEPWTEAATATTLMEEPPEPAAVRSRREINEVGVTVVTFENGIEAWLKPTDFKSDQIVFTMYSPGGASLAPPEQFVEASLAPSYVGLAGAGGLGALERQRLLAGTPASASSFIALSTHGVSGSAAPAELETALQLLYQNVTDPGDDPEAFALLTRQLEAFVANAGQNPQQVFSERVSLVNASDHYTAEPITAEHIERLDRERMLAFYRERFANAADFAFFMVGTFEPDAAIPLLARYLGSLPSTGRRTAAYEDLGIRFPAGIDTEAIEMGREPQSRTVISFFADPPADPIAMERIGAATTVLEITLRDVLREDLGQTYTVSVARSQPLPQRGAGHIQIRFGAAPENIEAMTDRVLAEVRRLQQDGPSDDLTTRAKESARRGYETSLRQNGYWMGRLQTIHFLGGDPAEIVGRQSRIDAITPDAVRDALRDYFPLDRYAIVTLMPESADTR